MKRDVYITLYTKEKGKLELTKNEWRVFNLSSFTYHREDGPAREWRDGYKEWWIDDMPYSKEDFNQIIQEAKALPLELRLTDPRWWVREMK